MNREIKFRAWDDGKMLTMPLNTNYGISRFFGILREDAIIMQFTGLLDKNGKEIYEGDIIKRHTGALTILPNSPVFHKGIIVWNELICAFQYSYNAIGGQMTNTLYDHDSATYEVIGNIYSKPELLKP